MTEPDRRPYALSKSRFMEGVQCHKFLWWRIHEPDAPELEVDPVLQDLFDQGSHVGEVARERFPSGVLIDLPYDDFEERLEATRRAWESGAPAIFEACFSAHDVFVAVDILERTPDGARILEVKSSTKQKPEHLPDAMIQTYVLRQCGIDVREAAIMHLNPEYRHPGPKELFEITDVTPEIEAYLLPSIPNQIDEMLDMLEGSLPDVAVGGRCNTPRDCPFFERCWPDDQNHVRHLYNVGPAKAGSLVEKGIHSILDLPESGKLSDIVRRQKRALRGGRMIVEDGLADALGEFELPIGYLDFETVGRAVPLWDGVKPWEPVPAQFSYHEVAADGSIRHVEWLANGPGDPRPGIARALVDAIGPVDHVVTYASGFELGCIRRLGKAVSELSGQLDELETRIVDLLPVVRDHIYHPDFHGSFSLKPVLAALVPDLAYDDLRIGGGQLASIEISRLMLDGEQISSRARRTLRRELLDYCKRDTIAMVALLRELQRIALAPANSSPR